MVSMSEKEWNRVCVELERLRAENKQLRAQLDRAREIASGVTCDRDEVAMAANNG